MENEYLNHNAFPFIDEFTHMVLSMSSALNSRGQDHNYVNVFSYLLPEDIINKLRDADTQHLVNAYNNPVEEIVEYFHLIATKMLRSRFRMSTSRLLNS